MLSLRTRGPDSGKLETHISRELASPVFCRGCEVNRRDSSSHQREAHRIRGCQPERVYLECPPSPGLSFPHSQAVGLFRVQSLALETARVLSLNPFKASLSFFLILRFSGSAPTIKLGLWNGDSVWMSVTCCGLSSPHSSPVPILRSGFIFDIRCCNADG